jgi:TPR repeat protein
MSFEGEIKIDFDLILNGDDLMIDYIKNIIEWSYLVNKKDINQNIIKFCETNIDNLNVKYIMSKIYETGHGVSKDRNKCFELLTECANNNNKFGQFGLGEFYQCGESRNFKNRDEQVLYWHTKSHNNGCILATISLAYIYMFKKDSMDKYIYHNEAFELCKSVSDSEYIWAEICMADIYRLGISVKENGKEAMKWYMKAYNNKYNFHFKENIIGSIYETVNKFKNLIIDKWNECDEKDKYILHLETKPPEYGGVLYEKAKEDFENLIYNK